MSLGWGDSAWGSNGWGGTLDATGVAATGAVGSVTSSRTVALSGVASTGAIGTVAPVDNPVETGDQANGYVGDVGNSRTVALTGDGAIPANGALVVGPGGSQAEAMADAAAPPSAAVTLTQPVTNGLGYKFTFNFEKAGSTTVSVPISAPEYSKQ